MNKSIIIGIGIVVVVASVLCYFFIFQKSDVSISPIETIEEEAEGLGSELYQNPGSTVPETNPYKKVETNPLKGINPFGNSYVNPFE